ncbi:MAG: hypothetical protein HY049_06925 [Acidobacteria bacterium]|nr:hypothetical protein [Acidobacteriota bacterium]
MSRNRLSIAKSMLPALAAVAALAVLTGLIAAAPQGPQGIETKGASAPAASSDDAAGTDAACRRAPECSTDADCDAICGVGLGHCVHSSCPVRICKCR